MDYCVWLLNIRCSSYTLMSPPTFFIYNPQPGIQEFKCVKPLRSTCYSVTVGYVTRKPYNMTDEQNVQYYLLYL